MNKVPFKLSTNSKNKLLTCNPRAQAAVHWLLHFVDVGVADGHRNEAKQNQHFTNGASQKQWPDSKHNKYPSNAFDLYAYVAGIGGIMDRTKSARCNEYYARIAGLLESKCAVEGWYFRWGGNWDGDQSLDDQTFNDLMHFEIW